MILLLRPGRLTVRFRLAAWLPILLLLASCSTLEPSTGNLEQDLRHRDPRLRVLAARSVVNEERTDLIPLLVDNLSDRDSSVRFWTAIALRKLTGQNFGFKSHAPTGERRRAIQRWQEWAGS